MTATDTRPMVHGANLPTITPALAAQIAEHERLIRWTIRHRARPLIQGGYTADDAWQDGWLGLAKAVATYGTDHPRFPLRAISCIWHEICRGRGIAEGRNWRRAPERRDWIDRAATRSTETWVAEDQTIGDLLEAPDPAPDQAALDADDLARAVAAGRRACGDHIDRAVLAWILNPYDERPARLVAQCLHRHPEAIRRRRMRLTDRMARALTTYPAKG